MYKNLLIKLNPYNHIFREATHKIRALPNLGISRMNIIYIYLNYINILNISLLYYTYINCEVITLYK